MLNTYFVKQISVAASFVRLEGVEIWLRAKWNIFNSVSGQSLNCFHEARRNETHYGVLFHSSFWKKLNFILGGKWYVNTTGKWNHSKGNIYACKYFIKIKIIDQKIKNRFHFGSHVNTLCITANGNILDSGNLSFRVFKFQLKVINKRFYFYSVWVNQIN